MRAVPISWIASPGGEHFRALNGDVPGHGALVFTPITVNFQRGNIPGIELTLVDFDIVAVIWQAFAKAAYSHAPGAGHLQSVLEFRAEAGHPHAAGPAVAATAALIAVAAKEVFVFGFDVAETRDVNTIGAVAERHFVLMAGHRAARAAAHMVIHEIVAELTARVGKSRGEFRSRGIEKNAGGLESGSAKEKEAALEFEGVFGLRINDANAADAASLGIEMRL